MEEEKENYLARQEFKEEPAGISGYRWIRQRGKWYLAEDVGCEDFVESAQARERQHKTDTWWKQMEYLRDTTPMRKFKQVGIPVNWEEKNENSL